MAEMLPLIGAGLTGPCYVSSVRARAWPRRQFRGQILLLRVQDIVERQSDQLSLQLQRTGLGAILGTGTWIGAGAAAIMATCQLFRAWDSAWELIMRPTVKEAISTRYVPVTSITRLYVLMTRQCTRVPASADLATSHITTPGIVDKIVGLLDPDFVLVLLAYQRQTSGC